MNIEQIRKSGILELYVLGDLSTHENSTIHAYLSLFPELKTDLNNIESTLYLYAKAHGIKPSSNVLQKIIAELPSSFPVQKSRSWIRTFYAISILCLLGGVTFQLVSKQKKLQDHNTSIATLINECDNSKQYLLDKIALYEELNNIDNQIIAVQATPKYQETKMVLNCNPKTRRNFIQFQYLPPIGPNQSYQLWSLKDDTAPIALDVFENTSELLEVQFESNTLTYAITIEPKGGQKLPTLENIIGIFPMS